MRSIPPVATRQLAVLQCRQRIEPHSSNTYSWRCIFHSLVPNHTSSPLVSSFETFRNHLGQADTNMCILWFAMLGWRPHTSLSMSKSNHNQSLQPKKQRICSCCLCLAPGPIPHVLIDDKIDLGVFSRLGDHLERTLHIFEHDS